MSKIDYKPAFDTIINDRARYMKVYHQRKNKDSSGYKNGTDWVRVLIPSLRRWRQLIDCKLDSTFLY